MHKRAALKLKRGDMIVFGFSQWTAQHSDRDWMHGTVSYVSPKGGIKLTNGTWVPYNHVLQQIADEEEWRLWWR